jgi:hypothetical protein
VYEYCLVFGLDCSFRVVGLGLLGSSCFFKIAYLFIVWFGLFGVIFVRIHWFRWFDSDYLVCGLL